MADKAAAAKKPAAKATTPKAEGAKKPAAAAPKTAEKAAAKPAASPAKKEDKPAPKAAAAAPKTSEKPAAKPAAAPKAAAPKAAAPKAAAPEKKAEPKKAAAPAAKPEVKREAYKPVVLPGQPMAQPESAFKKQQRDASLKARADAHKSKARKAARLERRVIFKRAQKYAKEHETQQKQLIRQKRQAKNSGNFFIAPEPKVLFVVRVKGIMRTSPKTTKVLQLLRLRQINNGVFIKANKATLTLLRLVEPYVTYGEPNRKTVSDLIYKRGHGKVEKQRIPLIDNSVVKGALGQYGIICVEDLVNEIYTCGPHFKEANNFLWPFKLNSPLGGWVDKGTHFAEGGDAGNREEFINQLVRRMN
jgi:large subunit ribosomal protein L7e